MRVPVVEDNEKLAALIARALTRNGLAVDVTHRGEDAVWVAGGTTYHAIVLDVYIRYLCEKIDLPFGTNSIETVRGAGYRLR